MIPPPQQIGPILPSPGIPIQGQIQIPGGQLNYPIQNQPGYYYPPPSM